MAAEEIWEDGSGLGGEDAGWEGEDHGGGVGRGNAAGVCVCFVVVVLRAVSLAGGRSRYHTCCDRCP